MKIFKLMKKDTLLSNKLFLKVFIKLLVCIDIKTQLLINCIFMVCMCVCVCVIFKAQLNYL
jgi:hypothetical protein